MLIIPRIDRQALYLENNIPLGNFNGSDLMVDRLENLQIRSSVALKFIMYYYFEPKPFIKIGDTRCHIHQGLIKN